jgi:hypothetical protein
LVAFKDVVKGLRDGWKDQVQAMKTAENHGDNDKATKLKQAVALQRRTMEKIISATLETGHPVIVEKLGEHPVTLSVFYSFLADRFQAADLEGSLTSNLLKVRSISRINMNLNHILDSYLDVNSIVSFLHDL